MSVSYDVFEDVFFNKIMEYEFVKLDSLVRNSIIDGYLKRACASFNHVCKYDLSKCDDTLREIDVDIDDDDLDEIADIISTGMVVHWVRPYLFHQMNLEELLGTKDYTTYSPAELTFRIREVYQLAQKDFVQQQRHYSYNHGDLTDLHT